MVNLTLCITVFIGVYSLCATAPSDSATLASKNILAKIGDMINNKIEPCANFYDYVCSNSNVNPSAEVAIDVNEKITNLIKRVPKPTDGTAIKKYYEFYEYCKKAKTQYDGDKIPTVYRHPYRILSNIMENYFLYTNFLQVEDPEKELVSPQLMARMEAALLVGVGYNFIVPIGVNKPIKNLEFIRKYDKLHYVEIPTLSKSLLQFDPEFLHKKYNSAEKDLRDTINSSVAEFLFGVSTAIVNVNHSINVLTKMEREIAKAVRSINNDEIEEMTVTEAMTKMPEFDWKRYILTLQHLSGANLTKNCKVENCPLQFVSMQTTNVYLKFLSTLTTKDYLIYLLTRAHMQAVVEQNGLLDANETIDCNVLVQRIFPLVKQHLYITETYPTAAEREKLTNSISNMIENLQSSVKNMFEKVPWIRNDKKTYAAFVEKLEKIKTVSGFPPQLLDQNWLDEQYSDFGMNSLSGPDVFPYNLIVLLYTDGKKYLAKNMLEKQGTDILFDYTEKKSITQKRKSVSHAL